MNNRTIENFIIIANYGYGFKVVYDTRETQLEPKRLICDSVIDCITIDNDIVIIEI